MALESTESNSDNFGIMILALHPETIPMTRVRHLFIIVLASFPAMSLDAAEATLLSGKTVSGEIVAVEAESLTFKTQEPEPIKIGFKELASIDLGHPIADFKATPQDLLELIDGSLLRIRRPGEDEGQKFLVPGKKVTLETLAGPKGLELPKFDIALTSLSFLQRSAHDTAAANSWKTLLARREKRDSLVIVNAGVPQRMLGTVLEGNESGERIVFEDERGEKLNFALSRVTGGLIFNQPPRDVIPPTICRVYDVFGNLLVATKIELGPKSVKVITVSGATVEYPSQAALSRLDFSQSNVTYLSVMSPKVSAPDDLVELFLTYTIDKTRQGKPLQLGGKAFAKGICVFGGVTLSYDLAGEYREFKTVLGIDDSIEVANKVKLTILADGRSLFSEVIQRKDKPRELILDVKDVKELRIVVEQEELFSASCINLCEARVQK
jgi:hypothetical protein